MQESNIYIYIYVMYLYSISQKWVHPAHSIKLVCMFVHYVCVSLYIKYIVHFFLDV